MEEKTITNQEYYDSEKKILKSERILTKEYDGYEAIEEYREYFENGQLKIKGEYVTGQKGNEWLYYKDDGTLIEKEHYIEGILLERENYEINDKAKEYFNDQEEYKGFYKETYYNKRVASEEINLDGKRSKKKVYSEEGELLYSEENKYEENKVIQNRYYASGKLEKEREAIIDGDNGTERIKEYYETGELRSETDRFRSSRDLIKENIKEYYISGELKKERKADLNYKDKKTYTIDLEYDKSGNVTYERILDNGKLNQKVFEYEADKLIKERGITSYYKDGNHNIEVENEKEYYKSGKLEKEIIIFENGNTILNNYSELGKLISTSEEKENSIINKEYYESGQLKSEINTSKTGESIENNYSELGKLLSTREEKETGVIVKEYYRSGILKQEKSFSRINENGEYHVYGSIKDYYSNGNLKSEVTTVDSLYHGEYKEYYSNGVLEYERTYENGKALNNFKFYKENGKLEYDHEKAENSLINRLHSFIFKGSKEKENLEEKDSYIWRSYTEGASPQDLVYKEIEDRKNEIIYKGLEKEEAGLENDKVISHEKNKENKELDNVYKEYYDNGSLKLEYENRISKEYYQDGKLKSSKEYDENLEADGIWKFYEKDGSVNRMEVYAGGELLEVSKKEYGTTEIGFVHYVYNGYNEVQRKEYAPNEDEYIKVYYEDGGAKDIYHERDGMTFYTRRNENDEIVAKGTFDEEMKKVGDWVTLDKTNTPTNIKTYDEDILIKEVNYKNGILNGPMREYDKETGELISEKIFKGGAEEKLMETLRAAQPIQEKSQGIER